MASSGWQKIRRDAVAAILIVAITSVPLMAAGHHHHSHPLHRHDVGAAAEAVTGNDGGCAVCFAAAQARYAGDDLAASVDIPVAARPAPPAISNAPVRSAASDTDAIRGPPVRRP